MTKFRIFFIITILTAIKNESISIGLQFKYHSFSDTLRFNRLRDSVFNSIIIE